VKNWGLAIPDPTTTVDGNWMTFTVICGHLIATLQGTVAFRLADHNHIMSAGRAKMRLQKRSDLDKKLVCILSDLMAD
jgi:hypothetical protein